MRRGWQPPAVEAAAAVATMLAIVVVPAVTGGGLSWGGTGSLALCLAVLQPMGRCRPLAALSACAIVLVGLNAAELIDGGWVWPASVAYVRAGLRGHSAGAAVIGALCLAGGYALDGEMPAGEALWLCLILTASLAYRTHRRLDEEKAAGLRAAQQVALARDVHDIIAHTLAVLGIQLTVAQDAFDDDSPDEARQAVRLAQQVRGEAVGELRSLIGALREESAAADRLSALIDRVRASGVDVVFRREGHAAVPAPVAWAVYRVVQEALTNNVKHSRAQRAEVVISHVPGEVRLRVADDGQVAADHRAGYGIAGMRERVTALGGTLTAGPSEGGFAVQAVIPTTVGPAKEGSTVRAVIPATVGPAKEGSVVQAVIPATVGPGNEGSAVHAVTFAAPPRR